MELLDGANGISTNLVDFHLSSDNYFQTYDKKVMIYKPNYSFIVKKQDDQKRVLTGINYR